MKNLIRRMIKEISPAWGMVVLSTILLLVYIVSMIITLLDRWRIRYPLQWPLNSHNIRYMVIQDG
ncbi:hypothetical protein SAMN02746089_01149 [Caldanaerobius fijiensis DSM 17918]|uniref:Uncharacterized protein n=1 Tax=Caldanaerobius fijiensis DSM 17918 TaxID=1121256 RepID=A0A1M4Y483_9THEO|nr:hypothetical protein [Caldanaerobius fijiensis]SHF00416.1 hypothetical protein SAMN02746089_01149 [Caldanaerobius fijiensis DSM 17918]